MKQQKKTQLKIKIKISKPLRDIIHGYIMSDGYVNKKGILCIEQSQKQEKFVLWLSSKLQSIMSPAGIKKHTRIHPLTLQQSHSIYFNTKAVLQGFHNMWYLPYVNKKGIIGYKKKLPKTINCFFNHQLISVWFAGDGTKTIGSLGAKFEVTCFTAEERLHLKKLFLTKFDIQVQIIKSGISKKGNIQWALKIPANQYSKFRKQITKTDLIPHLFPNKLCKLDKSNHNAIV